MSTIDKDAPLREIWTRGQNVGWMTDDLQDSMHRRDALHRQARRTRSQEDLSQAKLAKKRVNKQVQQAKRAFLDATINTNADSPNSLDGTVVNDTPGIANAFNAFFSTVGAKLADRFQNIKSVIQTRCEETFKFQQVRAVDVHKLLANIQAG